MKCFFYLFLMKCPLYTGSWKFIFLKSKGVLLFSTASTSPQAFAHKFHFSNGISAFACEITRFLYQSLTIRLESKLFFVFILSFSLSFVLWNDSFIWMLYFFHKHNDRWNYPCKNEPWLTTHKTKNHGYRTNTKLNKIVIRHYFVFCY